MGKNKKILKRFISYYKPHRWLFFIDLVCAFIVSVIDLFFPVITRRIVQTIIPNGEISTFWIFIGVMVFMYIARTALRFVVEYWGHILGVRIEYDMRKDLFTHLQTLSFRFFDRNRTGHLMSRMVNDLAEIAEFAHHGPEDLFLSLVMLIGSFFVLIRIEWRLALMVYAFIPVMVWYGVNKRKDMNQAFRDMRIKLADINAQLESSISGVRVSKSFTNEEHEIDKFDRGNIKFRGSKYWAYRFMALFHTGIELMSALLNITVIAAGGYMIFRGIIDLADLLAFIMYIGLFMQPVRQLSNFVQQFESGMTGIERFSEIMDEKPDIIDDPNARELKNVKGEIGFHNVSFSYDNNEKVLENINIKIDAGKTFALVGPSGGGKTTLCHLIPRFYEVNEGYISIDGRDIKEYTLKSLRKNIGIVQQDVFLFAGTIGENILYGDVESTYEEMIEAAKAANIHDFIMGLPDGYDTHVGERGVRLSGGQKQRISIARVFLKNPPILILDEATSALDNETEIKIQQALENLSKGRTTLVIAHRLSTIKNADEIFVLTENGVEERGDHETLLEMGGIYSNLYRSQFKDLDPEEFVGTDMAG